MTDANRPVPLIRVHSKAQATAALAEAAARGRPVDLLSSAGGPGFQGRAWFRAMVAAAARPHPDALGRAIVDCGDAPGHALACLDDGATAVALSDLPAPALARLRSIAAQGGAAVLVDPLPDLDLLEAADAATACRALFDR